MNACDTVNCQGQGTATVHVLLSCPACGRDPFQVCRFCVTVCLRNVMCCTTCGHDLRHVADHPIEPQCRHPEARWVNDRCEIDGLEVPEWADELAGVPA